MKIILPLLKKLYNERLVLFKFHFISVITQEDVGTLADISFQYDVIHPGRTAGMTSFAKLFLHLDQIDPPAHETGDIGYGQTIHFPLVESNTKCLFFWWQGAGLLYIGILKFKFGIVCVERVIQVVHSF